MFKQEVTKEEINELPLIRYEGEVVVVTTADELADALADLNRQTVLGFDTESRPSFRKGEYYPILGQIRSLELTNTLIVVIRYFGGTKLGVSGLIQAYRTTAAEALAANEIVEETITQSIQLMYGYEQTNEVMRLVGEFEMQIEDQQFTDHCLLKASVRQSYYLQSLEKAAQMTGVEVKV